MSDDNDTVRDDSSSNSPDPLGIIGWVIGGKYKVESYISGGGFGEVYAGYNQHLTEQRVVIKFFKRVQSREKFDKEARILCQLDHPNICRVIDYLPDEGAAVVAFIDGEDGGQILKKHGALPEKLFLNVAKSMTNAIAYAHSKKIAHRDLKPGNILVDKNEHVYLIDFGIAKEIGGDATKTAYTALTPMFAAPERQTGEKGYNPFLSDIYEMGVTLFNFATGSLPYRNPVNPNFGEWGGQAAEHLSPELRRVLLKATHPNPEKRYQTAEEMADDFDKLTRAYGSSKKFPTGLLVAAVIVVALVFFGWKFGGSIVNSLFGNKKQAKKTEQVQPATETAKPPIEQQQQKPAGSASSEKPSAKKPKPVSNEAKQTNKPETKATTETAKKPTKPTAKPTENKKTTKPVTPPTPTMSEVRIQVAPADNVTVTVDGKKWNINKRQPLPFGRHTIQVIHPDFPIYTKRVRIKKERSNINIDLIKQYPNPNLVDIQLALSPPSDNLFLEFSFNGKKKTISRFPALDVRQSEGKWAVNLSLKTLGQNNKKIKVDSCVTFPYGGGPHHTIKGNSGILQLGSDKAGEITSVPIVVFWSKN